MVQNCRSNWLRARLARAPLSGVVTLLSSAGLALVLTACGGGGGETPGAKAVRAASQQTITFALSGLNGEEGLQIKKEIRAFEKLNPSIGVRLDVISGSSPNSRFYLEQLERLFRAGATAPDLMELEVNQPQTLARAGWIRALNSFKPDLRNFFAAEVAAGELDRVAYAIPWVDNTEGLFYRTDLVRREPKTPAEVLADARAAVARDSALQLRALNEPFAFAGFKNEAIATLETVAPAFGGGLTTHTIDTKGNVRALEWLRTAIYKQRIAPRETTRWDVGPVQDELNGGRAAFALDYPFVFDNEEQGSPATGKLAYIPFPAGPEGRPGSALDGEMLAINARSRHTEAAYKLIEYLTSQPVETARAEAIFTPPSVRSAYDHALLAKRPVFSQVRVLNEDAQPGLLSPDYWRVALVIREALATVLDDNVPASEALKHAAAQVNRLRST